MLGAPGLFYFGKTPRFPIDSKGLVGSKDCLEAPSANGTGDDPLAVYIQSEQQLYVEIWDRRPNPHGNGQAR